MQRLTADPCLACWWQGFPGLLLQNHFPASLPPACTGAWSYSFPGAGLGNCLCRISWGSCLPVSPNWQGPSEWQSSPPAHQATPQNLLASTDLLKICFDLICLKTFYRRNHLQGRVRHRGVHLSKVSRLVVKSGLSPSCLWGEHHGCLARSLLGLLRCAHVQGDIHLMQKEFSAGATVDFSDRKWKNDLFDHSQLFGIVI